MGQKILIAGPCAVESREQVNAIASFLAKFKVKYIRGGCYKPRTRSESFQGLGFEGIKILHEAARANSMLTVSEVLTAEDLAESYEYIDVVQVGSRSMTSFGLLKQIGRATAKDKKPVLLKRGMGSTIPEMVHASKYITSEGNHNVYMCLRGIRTFEQMDSEFRNTADLGSILELKEKGFKVIYDPAHACGIVKHVPPIARAALELGADGVMVEVHNNPEKALCDGHQSLNFDEFEIFLKELQKKGYLSQDL